jgi:carbohydrate-binding DOMON domain-containing protein
VTVTVTVAPSTDAGQNMTTRELISLSDTPTPVPTVLPTMSPTSAQSPGFGMLLMLACLMGTALVLLSRKFR